ncbi:hypothetical protein GCM10010206_44890 [Streptomyces cinerochromogenes]|nr:hypothetical protein GCM10010206_44890 [Streptomyces cinerochromogenes]
MVVAGGPAVAVVMAAVSRAPAARVTAVPTTDPRMAAPTRRAVSDRVHPTLRPSRRLHQSRRSGRVSAVREG